MTKPLPDFKKMWANYPDGEKMSVVHDIGGKIEQSVTGNPDAWSSCTIRLSKGFNYAGDPIPAKHTLKKSPTKDILAVREGGDKLWYAYRVDDMKLYVQEIYGPADGHLSVVEKGGPGVSTSTLPSKKLLVFFRFLDESHQPKPQWASHADLWDGSAMRYNNILDKPEHSKIHVTYWEFN